jgi:hypothetical protein
MAKYSFPVPDRIVDMLTLMNESRRLRLTMVRPDGAVRGYYATEYGTQQMPGTSAYRFILGSLDDGMTIAVMENENEAAAFIYGTFLGVFGGQSMEKIQSGVHQPWEGPL